MAEVAKSSGTQSGQMTMVDVWTEIRGLENALRFYADAFNGWMTYGKLDPKSPIRGLSGGPIAWPKPMPDPCDPPWCPMKGPEVVTGIKEAADRVARIAAIFEHVERQINVEQGQEFYISELPGTNWASGNGDSHGDH